MVKDETRRTVLSISFRAAAVPSSFDERPRTLGWIILEKAVDARAKSQLSGELSPSAWNVWSG
jgi:hypothetical protein